MNICEEDKEKVKRKNNCLRKPIQIYARKVNNEISILSTTFNRKL